MRVRLTRRQKVWVDAGTVIEAAPADAAFLMAVGAAIPEATETEPTERPAEDKPKAARKTAKKS